MPKNFIAYSDGRLGLNLHSVRAALGKGGVIDAAAKREGDGKSPLGAWPIRYVFYRPDRVAKPETQLPVVALSPDDGWCDDPADPAYNTHVKLPWPTSHEKLWRDDHVYDLIVVLGHNDDPVVPGMGSAIFMHLAREDYSGTEGCVALGIDDLLDVLSEAEPGSQVEIRD
ncbi:L,D-transpeptidase family protein [Asticcacaulis solisilvae]|uniref:L,D-transpeptidase family protein n=1 Tax=Asticcacaulis solisilvae TaxID=1217274 RepID=UPI003FD7A35F